jgi:NTE family protein
MNYPFKNLVFKGGGIRGIAYLGALEVINEKGLLAQAENVAGASAGAITALLVSLGYSFEEIKERANALDYKKIQQEPVNPSDKPYLTDELKTIYPTPRGIVSMIMNPIDTYNQANTYLGRAVNLQRRFGLYSNEYIYNWFGDQIEEKCGNRKATFADLVETEGCKNLSVTITNIVLKSTHICNANHTPDLEVAKAVLASMSIPMFFEAVFIDDKDIQGLFADGGVMHNFPISIYDYENQPNPETLGFFIYSDQKETIDHAFDLKNYIGNTIGALLAAQDWEFARTPDDIKRSIQISDCQVSATNFDVVYGDDHYNNLYEAGKKGAAIYFDNYENDTAANEEAQFVDTVTKHLA